MKLTLVCVGRIKEGFFREALEEYKKRLGRYCSLKIIELADEATREGATPAQDQQVLAREGDRILKALPSEAYIIILDLKGKKMDSVAFSKHIERLGIEGNSHIAFVIGGSLGLAGEVRARGDYVLSFSDMTFPHQLMRVILLEQIYRAFRIMKGEPYHK